MIRVARLATMAVLLASAGCAGSAGSSPTAPEPAAQAFLDTLQQRTFNYFWETANPANGLVPDRWPTPSFSSVAAVGFGLTAYPVGVERGYVTRDQAVERTLNTLRFFWKAPQGPQVTGVAGYHGFFYHFLDMQTGHRFEKVELSTIDTGLFLMGALAAQEYFGRDDPREREIRALADSLYRRVEWDRMQLPSGLISMGWKPDQGRFDFGYRGYTEAMFLNVLALGSPTHPVDARLWPAFTSTYIWGNFHGQEHVNFAPLFGHQYSHVWIDFRGIQDEYMRERGIDYFENSRRATLSQRQYAIDNPGGWKGYSGDMWGLTASDGPIDTTLVIGGRPRTFHTYWARGAALDEINDDGTLVPTAAGGSIPFAPEVTIPALMRMRARYGDHLFQQYGFLDAFNPTLDRQTDLPLRHGRIVPGVGWFDGDYLGIDQGPIVIMAENYRTALIWKLMRDNPYVVRGLCRAGFAGGWLEGKCR